MDKLEIIFLVTVVEVGDLHVFNLNELSEFWSALTICRNDEEFFAKFDTEEQRSILRALDKVEKELKRRHTEPINFFQLMQDNPARVEFYLSKFSLDQLLSLENDLTDFQQSKIVADFLKLVRQQIYRCVPMA